MKRLFLINPNARGVSPRAIGETKSFFLEKTGSFEFQSAVDWKSARELTRRALRNKEVEQVVAMGGDGTVNAVVNGFFEGESPLHPAASLAVSDLGTGSDYFRSVRADRKDTSRDWKNAVLNPAICQVDLGLIRFVGDSREPMYFANALTGGITADIVRAKHALPFRLPPSLSYLIPTIGQLLKNRGYPVQIETSDGQTLEKTMVALFVAKGAFLGGGMRLTESADLSNGTLELILVEKMPVPGLIWRLRELYRKGLRASPGITRLPVKSARLLGSLPIPLECDGEPLGEFCFSVEALPNAIRLCR